MKQIYEGADEIYVWLSPEANDNYLAMQKLDNLNKYFRQQGLGEAAAQIVMNLVNQRDTSWIFGPRSELFDERSWRALEKLFERPWWTRVWIIQESPTFRSSYLYFLWKREYYNEEPLYCLHRDPHSRHQVADISADERL
jgi:hypothetical protein